MDKQTDHIPDPAKKVDRTMIAAMAMQGILSAQKFSQTKAPNQFIVAEAATIYADALIAELKKKKK